MGNKQLNLEVEKDHTPHSRYGFVTLIYNEFSYLFISTFIPHLAGAFYQVDSEVSVKNKLQPICAISK
ncbi:CLUMA_CG008883, isoform A [Clunio marinus]|uniref:CLUMA_CG008883, isoform A n=1 Tax=Clunio marinus TaxID=568069 RepID=A0A1J1I6K4_9DIPT|nr:CLUMA_CG008883, isoform A [Clunio marinus]